MQKITTKGSKMCVLVGFPMLIVWSGSSCLLRMIPLGKVNWLPGSLSVRAVQK